MFYVVGKKVYLATPDAETGVYKEISLVKTAEGGVQLVPGDTGVKSKPKRRQLCTAREVLAQLGAFATEVAPPVTPPAE